MRWALINLCGELQSFGRSSMPHQLPANAKHVLDGKSGLLRSATATGAFRRNLHRLKSKTREIFFFFFCISISVFILPPPDSSVPDPDWWREECFWNQTRPHRDASNAEWLFLSKRPYLSPNPFFHRHVAFSLATLSTSPLSLMSDELCAVFSCSLSPLPWQCGSLPRNPFKRNRFL